MSVLSNTDAASLDQRITFQSKVETQTASGELTHSWVNFAVNVHACINALKAAERYAAEQELPAGDYTVWIRWRGDLNTNMRILWGSRVLDVKGIPDQQKRGRFLAIFAEEGVTEG